VGRNCDIIVVVVVGGWFRPHFWGRFTYGSCACFWLCFFSFASVQTISS